MFIAGLHEPIRKEIMKHMYAIFQAVYKVALDLEIIQRDNKAAKTVMVAATEENNNRTTEYDDEEIKVVHTAPTAPAHQWRKHFRLQW